MSTYSHRWVRKRSANLIFMKNASLTLDSGEGLLNVGKEKQPRIKLLTAHHPRYQKNTALQSKCLTPTSNTNIPFLNW